MLPQVVADILDRHNHIHCMHQLRCFHIIIAGLSRESETLSVGEILGDLVLRFSIGDHGMGLLIREHDLRAVGCVPGEAGFRYGVDAGMALWPMHRSHDAAMGEQRELPPETGITRAAAVIPRSCLALPILSRLGSLYFSLCFLLLAR